MSTPRLNDRPCPRCECWVVRTFNCYCREVHSDYCDNCGRWTSLTPEEHATLSRFDATCWKGDILHEHDPKERTEAVRRLVQSWRTA